MEQPDGLAASNVSQHDHDRLEGLIDEIAADVGVSGAIRVDLDGTLAVQRAFGPAHRGLGVASTADTQFAIASGRRVSWARRLARHRGRDGATAQRRVNELLAAST
jgi:hypothetical protein